MELKHGRVWSLRGGTTPIPKAIGNIKYIGFTWILLDLRVFNI